MLERILNLMKQNRTKGKELCEFLGVQESTISDWKNGKTESYKKHLIEIANFFGVSTDYLFGKTDNPAPTYTKGIIDSDLMFALFGGELPPEALENVKIYAQFIKERYNNKQ